VAGTTVATALQLSLEAPPSRGLTVELGYREFEKDNAPISTAMRLTPSVVSFGNTTTATQTVSLTTFTAGTFVLSVALKGLSASEYTIQYVGSTQLTVQEAGGVPEVPVLLSAQFADDGGSVVLSFDSATDKGGQAADGRAHV
jgi:hypothetical protein